MTLYVVDHRRVRLCSLASQDHRLISSYRDETVIKTKEIEELSDPNNSRVFHVTRCSACGGPPELPTIHFMCKHSYHQRFVDNLIDGCNVDEILQMSWGTRNRMSNLCSTTRRHTRNTAKQRASGGPARTVPCGRGGEWLQRRCECFQSWFDGATSTGRSCHTVILCSLHPRYHCIFYSSGQLSMEYAPVLFRTERWLGAGGTPFASCTFTLESEGR